MSTGKLDTLMEAASRDLVEMRYLDAERRCLDALHAARDGERWSYVARILLPLQEARRQRRMIAADTCVQLGTPEADDLQAWLDAGETRGGPAGCVVVTPPCSWDDAAAALGQLRRDEVYAEVLFADAEADPDASFDRGEDWAVFSAVDAALAVDVPTPVGVWVGRPLKPTDADWAHASAAHDAPTPADWFIDATERLGDLAIESVAHPPGGRARFDALWDLLDAAPDHEKLHQALADAARALVTKA